MDCTLHPDNAAPIQGPGAALPGQRSNNFDLGRLWWRIEWPSESGRFPFCCTDFGSIAPLHTLSISGWSVRDTPFVRGSAWPTDPHCIAMLDEDHTVHMEVEAHRDRMDCTDPDTAFVE